MKESPEFLKARMDYPLDRNDTVFVFMPSAFFRNMLSSHYQIENARRQQALVDIELLQLASTAAKGEGYGDLTSRELSENGFLPNSFSARPDFSGPVAANDQVIDSLRGARGYFKPVPDIRIEKVTEAEARKLQIQNDLVREQWKSIQPLVIALQRESLGKGKKERLKFSANITSAIPVEAQFLIDMLGKPTQYKHGGTGNDIIELHASMRAELLLKKVPAHQVFVCIQDEPTRPITVKPSGFFGWLQMLKGFPGYVGAWPNPGLLDTLTLAIGQAQRRRLLKICDPRSSSAET